MICERQRRRMYCGCFGRQRNYSVEPPITRWLANLMLAVVLNDPLDFSRECPFESPLRKTSTGLSSAFARALNHIYFWPSHSSKSPFANNWFTIWPDPF
jgi:hypothetical protein